MDIYKKKSNWNIFLALFGLLILIITLVYSNFLAKNLIQKEEANAKIYVKAAKDFLENSGGLNEEVGLHENILLDNKLRLILEDEQGVLEGTNWGEEKDLDQAFLSQQKEVFLNSGKEYLRGSGYAAKVYYFNTELVGYINYYPYIQMLLVGSFILMGYFFITASKRGEQNRVWAGMAKETAHQLGTPISAIIAWIEHLKLTEIDEEQAEIVEELRNDVNRLELVADRFSKIGSEPVLTATNIYAEIEKCKLYMERRAPRKVTFDYPQKSDGKLIVKINQHLFDWVIENLIRNSLDAMDGKGKLTCVIYEDGGWVTIDISDTGKGIPSSKFNTIFQPGFTTKKRGWGLGLSLAKRIIENYHNGKIFVKNSKPNENTTFTIKLPKAIL
ncbi:MAG: HAMP domain-containing sensor histidine kinase [Saprospiraceae bacterium]|nr:HAMP domain-containing sensor histidine kinase [Saprospiraceae bacterium]